MPRYDYECEDGHVFELKQSFNSEPTADCPVCEKASTRQFSVVPIVFKGSGWYVNDYGKKGSSSTSSAGNDGGDDSSDKSTPSDKSSSDGKAQAEKPKPSVSKEKASSKSGD